jgi:hypothetical protein
MNLVSFASLSTTKVMLVLDNLPFEQPLARVVAFVLDSNDNFVDNCYSLEFDESDSDDYQ